METKDMPHLAPNKPEFAIVEIMGHTVRAGTISEAEIIGIKMLCIETCALPELPEESKPREEGLYNRRTAHYENVPGRIVTVLSPAVPSETYFYPPQSIFSIRLCSESEAMADTEQRRAWRKSDWIPDVPIDDAPVTNIVHEDEDAFDAGQEDNE